MCITCRMRRSPPGLSRPACRCSARSMCSLKPPHCHWGMLAGASHVSWRVRSEVPMFVAAASNVDALYLSACTNSEDNTTSSEQLQCTVPSWACRLLCLAAHTLLLPAALVPRGLVPFRTACNMMRVANQTWPGTLCVARECHAEFSFDPALRDYFLFISYLECE